MKDENLSTIKNPVSDKLSTYLVMKVYLRLIDFNQIFCNWLGS